MSRDHRVYIFRQVKMMSVMALKDSLVRILLTACYTFWLYGVANSSDHLKEVIQRTADIKPGAGLQEIHEQVDKFFCKFQYKAQGGTKESWDFVISKDEKGENWACTVKRPHGVSYLFFEEFKLELAGSSINRVVIEKQPGIMLPEIEYIVKENLVQHHPGKFNSQLNSVNVYATTLKKREL